MSDRYCSLVVWVILHPGATTRWWRCSSIKSPAFKAKVTTLLDMKLKADVTCHNRRWHEFKIVAHNLQFVTSLYERNLFEWKVKRLWLVDCVMLIFFSLKMIRLLLSVDGWKWVNVNRYSGIQERYKQWSIALILECVLYIGLML